VKTDRPYSAAEMERMMKLQDVLLKAMAKKLSWADAAEIIGISCRSMRRWRERLERQGYEGVADRRKGKASPRRVPLATMEEVFRLYREKYFDLSVRHFHEKLREVEQIQLSYNWVKLALQGAGLVKRRRRTGPHRRRRERRPLPGMLLHIDGSRHRWFGDDRWYDLLVILDDATSQIYYAQLVEQESTRTVMAALREGIQKEGLFCSLYSDRGSHFFLTPKAGEKVDPHRLTQVGRAMKELGIKMIPAYSPQARGRSERNFGTWQGRLPQELRLAGIRTLEAANEFLRRYGEEFNRQFSVPAAQRGTAFRRCGRRDLDWVFTIQTERVVANDNTITIRDRVWQLDKSRWRHTLAGCTVTIHEHLDGIVSVRYGPHVVGRLAAGAAAAKPQRRGKDGALEGRENQPRVSPPFHRPVEISTTPRDSHFSTAPTTTIPLSSTKPKPKERVA
jgi:transposase